MLFPELASWTYTFNLFMFEGWEPNDDSFQLYPLELLEVDIANSFVPYLYVCIGFGAFSKHGRFHLVRIENEHSTFPSTTSDELAFLLDEATTLVEMDLHPLLQNLADWDQILRDGWYMQDVFNVCIIAFFAEWDIADMLNGVSSIISGLNIAGSIRLSKVSGPVLGKVSSPYGKFSCFLWT